MVILTFATDYIIHFLIRRKRCSRKQRNHITVHLCQRSWNMFQHVATKKLVLGGSVGCIGYYREILEAAIRHIENKQMRKW